ncbi:hypothetical protein ACLOJK_023185 [Asimina triloba]
MGGEDGSRSPTGVREERRSGHGRRRGSGWEQLKIGDGRRLQTHRGTIGEEKKGDLEMGATQNWRWEEIADAQRDYRRRRWEEVGDPAMGNIAGGGKRTGKTEERLEAGRCGVRGEQEDYGRRKEEKAQLEFIRRLRNDVMRSKHSGCAQTPPSASGRHCGDTPR